MRLDQFDNSGFDRGASWLLEAAWRIVEGLLFSSWIPGSGWRVSILRVFGAKIGQGVVIKPRTRVKFPWKLTVGDHSWIGEAAWIDNLDQVTIGAHCCLSQGVYLCTGNHRWDDARFNLETRPIRIEDHCWICAHAKIGPGVACGQGSILTMGSVASSNLQDWSVYSGVPAERVRARPNSTSVENA